ncbi:MAG: hypothetical protein JWO36_5016 [Myxococcales bacterium]|nr:hypothetical protein [Myxococcales bacterium]
MSGTMTASSGRYDSQVSGQQVRAIRVPRAGRRVLVIALGVASTVCAVACRETRATSTSKTMDPSVRPPPASSIGDATAADTPAARQFAGWLTAFNSGDRGALVTYHQQYFPYEVASEDVAGIDHEFGLIQGTGGFDLKTPENPTSTSIVAILKERRSDQFARATMEVDPAEPHRVVRFVIHPIPTPDEFLSPDERKSRLVDDAKRRSLIDGIAKELQGHYVAPDTAKQMIAALRVHLAHGDYDKITQGEEFAAAVTKDLRDVSHDLHLGLRFGRHPKGPGPTLDDQRAMGRRMNYGFGPIERMPGNVAHVVINGFPPIPDDEAREGVAGLMTQVADADALIVDLRNNGGGSPDTVALIASYLFDKTPVHLNDMFSRDTGSVQQSWTVRDLRGTRFGGQKPVYVLTSKRTFSGGEEFAYDLQSLHRAKIVGETTGGGAHPVAPHELDEWFTILVPWGRPINPVTKTNWEGVGVVPDVAVTADSALDEAHRRAIDDVSSKSKRPARP